MFCPKCGKENPGGAQLCSSCSWVLSSTSTGPAPGAKTSGAAIASLILGILAPFTCLVTTLPAIICGIVALVKISKSRGQLKGGGLAITGIALPVIVLPMIAILIAITVPALSGAKMQARRVACMSHMKQLGLSVMLYANEHNNVLPACGRWCDEIKPYLGKSAEKTFRCPAAAKCATCTYAMNKNIQTLAAVKFPATTVLLFESEPGWNQCGGPELLKTGNHQGRRCGTGACSSGGGAHVVFCDGHVEFIKAEDIGKLKWMPDATGSTPSNMSGPIDKAKWSEGKAMIGTIATAIRAYAAEKGSNGKLPTSIAELGLIETDLQGTYFQAGDFSINVTSMNPLKFTITCTASQSNAPVTPKIVTLNQDGVWTSQ